MVGRPCAHIHREWRPTLRSQRRALDGRSRVLVGVWPTAIVALRLRTGCQGRGVQILESESCFSPSGDATGFAMRDDESALPSPSEEDRGSQLKSDCERPARVRCRRPRVRSECSGATRSSRPLNARWWHGTHGRAWDGIWALVCRRWVGVRSASTSCGSGRGDLEWISRVWVVPVDDALDRSANGANID